MLTVLLDEIGDLLFRQIPFRISVVFRELLGLLRNINACAGAGNAARHIVLNRIWWTGLTKTHSERIRCDLFHDHDPHDRVRPRICLFGIGRLFCHAFPGRLFGHDEST